MRERGILFSGPMVRAILNERKSQTRRVMKPQPERGSDAEHCPYGIPGDRLWVRETWRLCGVYDAYTSAMVREHGRFIGQDNVFYAADGDREGFLWRSPLFMPRWASRITLEITDMRVQRVQEITDADSLAEGVDRTNTSIPGYARKRYEKLWDSINAKRGHSWDSNPWVWAITFKRVKP